MAAGSKPAGDVIRVAELADNVPREVAIEPAVPALRALAAELDLIELRKLRLQGVLRPDGARDWLFEARLGATVVQPCVVTTDPVVTRIEEPVVRRFTPDMPEPVEGEEMEMPEDDTLEPLGRVIDLRAVMAEALALALPDYPRKPDADLGEAVFAAPGVEPLTEERVKPFAGLADLRDRLKDGED